MSQIKDKQDGKHYWRYDTDCFPDINADYFSVEFWQATHAIIGQETGRGTTLFVQHNDTQLVLRHYLRGGLMRHLSHDQYLFQQLETTRSFAEFSILQLLHERGFAVPKPAAAQVVRQGFRYRADLLTHKIPDAQDLVRVLQHPQDADFYQSLGRFIANFHQHGVYHADLNIQNILVDRSDRFWLIDFDRARLLKPERRWQQNNLKRLKRSFEKECVRHTIHWCEADWNTFSESYQRTLEVSS
jgi:3-deoxy-D-manno-octulosonic acid kinase